MIWSLTVYLPERPDFVATRVVRDSKDDLGLARAMMALSGACSPFASKDAPWKPTVVIPCPSHKGRENPRSSALGAGAADALCASSQDILRRTDDNPPRSGTSHKESPRTVDEMVSQMTIECNAEFTGEERILIVDDTVTHGVTLGSAGLALKDRGATDIRAMTFARTRRPQDLIYNYRQDSGGD